MGSRGGLSGGGESRAHNNTHKRKQKAERGRLGVWLYSPHTRVARGEERGQSVFLGSITQLVITPIWEDPKKFG